VAIRRRPRGMLATSAYRGEESEGGV
jgi:hypothetical protein